MLTHFIPYDAGNRALCGDIVALDLADADPTCPDCVGVLDAADASISAFDPPEPTPAREDPPEPQAPAAVLRMVPKAPTPDVVAASAAPAPEDPPLVMLTVVERGASLAERAYALIRERITAATLAIAEALYLDLGAVEDGIHAEYDEGCALAYASWKSQTDKRSRALSAPTSAKQALGPEIATCRQAIKAEEARVQREIEEAAKREAKERADREAQQLREEADRKREEAAQLAVAAEEGETLSERLLAGTQLVAARAEATELTQAAAQVVEDAKHAPLPALARRPSTLSTGAVADKLKWVAELDNWATLRADIGAGKYPEFETALQEIVLSALNKLAPTLKQTLGAKYPGAEGRQRPAVARK